MLISILAGFHAITLERSTSTNQASVEMNLLVSLFVVSLHVVAENMVTRKDDKPLNGTDKNRHGMFYKKIKLLVMSSIHENIRSSGRKRVDNLVWV